jgi:hypothetical protein
MGNGAPGPVGGASPKRRGERGGGLVAGRSLSKEASRAAQ